MQEGVVMRTSAGKRFGELTGEWRKKETEGFIPTINFLASLCNPKDKTSTSIDLCNLVKRFDEGRTNIIREMSRLDYDTTRRLENIIM